MPEALRAASAFPPDVVLMDIGLAPGMDGWETARAMRKLPGLSETVFVAVTGYSRHEDVDRSYAAGFAAHFTKPFDQAELMDFLETVALERRPEARRHVLGFVGSRRRKDLVATLA